MLLMYVAVYDGLAIDIKRQKLYYADADKPIGKLGELSTDGRGHRVLIYEIGSQPRGVVLDDRNRCLYSFHSVMYSVLK